MKRRIFVLIAVLFLTLTINAQREDKKSFGKLQVKNLPLGTEEDNLVVADDRGDFKHIPQNSQKFKYWNKELDPFYKTITTFGNDSGNYIKFDGGNSQGSYDNIIIGARNVYFSLNDRIHSYNDFVFENDNKIVFKNGTKTVTIKPTYPSLNPVDIDFPAISGTAAVIDFNNELVSPYFVGDGSKLTNVNATTFGNKNVSDFVDLNSLQIITGAKAFVVGDDGAALEILNEKDEDAIYATLRLQADGFRVANEGSGVGFVSNGVGTSTGYLYTGENDGTIVYSLDRNGNLDTAGEVYTKGIVVDPLGTTSGIAGSNFTVKKQSTSTGTNVSQFIDVDRQASSTPSNTSSNTYGLVSRVVNNSIVEDAGFTGSNLVGRNSSSRNFNFPYGPINSAEALGSGNGNFVASTVNRSKVTGAATIDYMRGTGSTTTIDNVSATVNYMQGHHNSLVFTNGSVGQASVMYLDVDGGSATVTGDLAYIRAGNDALPTVNGNAYFIYSESVLPSELSGSLKTTQYKLSALNTAPSSSTDTGTIGEIRYTSDYIYVCVATNTWKRMALSTW